MAQTSYSSKDTTGTMNDLREKTGDHLGKVAEQVESAAKSVVEHGRDVGENVQKVAGNLKSAVDTSVKDQPMATLAVVAALGFVLGAIWKS